MSEATSVVCGSESLQGEGGKLQCSFVSRVSVRTQGSEFVVTGNECLAGKRSPIMWNQ